MFPPARESAASTHVRHRGADDGYTPTTWQLENAPRGSCDGRRHAGRPVKWSRYNSPPRIGFHQGGTRASVTLARPPAGEKIAIIRISNRPCSSARRATPALANVLEETSCHPSGAPADRFAHRGATIPRAPRTPSHLRCLDTYGLSTVMDPASQANAASARTAHQRGPFHRGSDDPRTLAPLPPGQEATGLTTHHA